MGGSSLAATTPGIANAYEGLISDYVFSLIPGSLTGVLPILQDFGPTALSSLSPSNVIAGTLSASQKAVLVQAESSALVQAGADPAAAAAQADSDVTGALVAEGADPSQDDTALYLAGAILVLGLGLYLWKAVP